MLFLGISSFDQAVNSRNDFTPLAQVVDTVGVSDAALIEEKEVGVVDMSEREVGVVPKKESSSSPSAVACVFDATNTPTHAPVIINEVAWMGSVNNSNHEWIELKNISNERIDISGWHLIDAGEQIHVVIPEKTRFVANGLYLLERGDDAVVGVSAHQEYTGALANTNEALRLFTAACELVDEVVAKPDWPAGNSKEKRTLERSDDLDWHTYAGEGVDGILGTPLRENSLPGVEAATQSSEESTTSSIEQTLPLNNETASVSTVQPETSSIVLQPIYISEVMVGSDLGGGDDEFIELYNPNDATVNLTGYEIKKRASTGSLSSLVTPSRFKDVIIPAKKHLLITHDGAYKGAVEGDIVFPASYSLAYTKNAVVLYDANGTLIHEASWAEIKKGQSYACDTTLACVIQETPTPTNSK